MRVAQFLRAYTRLMWPALALLTVATLCAACGSDTTTTTAPSITVGTVTETLNGIMAPKGQAVRTFLARQAGTVTVLLSNAQPSVTLGLGVGVRGSTGADCRFTQTLNTAPGTTPQLSVSVDPGAYCAGTYDIGTVGQPGVTVSVTVTHP